MSYVVQKKSEYEYIINEQQSGVDIQLITSRKNAYAIARKLNLGSGFQGYTPKFIAQMLSDYK